MTRERFKAAKSNREVILQAADERELKGVYQPPEEEIYIPPTKVSLKK